MSDVKVFLVKPPNKKDWDLEDIVKIARSQGKIILKAKDNVKVLDLIPSPYGYVAVVTKSGCSKHAGCKHENKRNE